MPSMTISIQSNHLTATLHGFLGFIFANETIKCFKTPVTSSLLHSCFTETSQPVNAIEIIDALQSANTCAIFSHLSSLWV